ncbi:MAG: hypothetical protein ACRC7S_03735 [Cetobacterium sp.]
MHPLITGMFAGIVVGALVVPHMIKTDRLNRVVSVEVNENGTRRFQTIKVEGLIRHMKEFDCDPFSVSDILRAKTIRTVAIGWVYTSFELIFDDNSSVKVFALHGDAEEVEELRFIIDSIINGGGGMNV